MDHQKLENGDKDIGDPRAPPVSPRTAGGINQWDNAESQAGGRMKPSAKTVHEVATKPKIKATTISLGGTSSDSFSLPYTERVPAANLDGSTLSETATSASGCENVFIGAQSVLGAGCARKARSKAKKDSAPGMSACSSLGAETGIATTGPPRRSDVGTYKHWGLKRKPKVDKNATDSAISSSTNAAERPLFVGVSAIKGNRGFGKKNKSHTKEFPMVNPSGNHAVDAAEKYFEDDLFIEKSRGANPSGNHADNAGCEGNADVWAEFEDDLLTKKRQMENPSCVSYLDKDPTSKENPSYISYLEENPPSISLPAVHLEPIPMPAPPNIGIVPQHRPGAYTQAPGAYQQRLDQPRFSLIGVECHENNDEEDVNNVNCCDHNDYHEDDRAVLQSDGHGTTTIEAGEVPTTNARLPSASNNGDDLAVATAIDDDDDNLSVLMEAQELDQEVLQKLENKERKRKKFRLIGCVVIAVCSIVLGLSLGLSFGRTEVAPSTRQPTMARTQSPTRSLPPMEKLELLYDELPEKTKECLYDSNSSQYQAWEWLLDHPNITTYPEWRKKQVFAVVTFFYSLEGTNWPEQIQNKWLNVTSSECHWASSEAEVLHFTRLSAEHFGPGAYRPQDIHPCNKNGEVQTLLIHQLYLSNKLTPHIPPEIGLLTSLRILAIQSGQIGGSELSDFLVPELILLPNLEFISFYSTGIHGTIPKEVGGMTGLRHLIIGENQLTGTFPLEIAKISSLEYLTLWRNEIAGSIPSELGWMTSLTALEIDSNHLTGAIPTELGLLSNIQYFWSGNNALSGSIPTQLGLITNCIDLGLGNGMEVSPEGPYNNFAASLPTELWQLLNLDGLVLNNLPNLHGSIPTEMMLNLTLFRLEGSPNLVGTIPEAICYLQEQKIDNFGEAMDFECSRTFCGCDCQCVNNKTNNI